MALRETGKERASRIQLDYYKHADRLLRVKLWLTLAALVPALLWLVGGLVYSRQAQALYSRGPVAAVHAAWEDKCEVCHTAYQPLSSENVTHGFVGDPHASDQKCTACHAGPIHHSKQSKDATATCATCHRDHRGRDASLVRLADADCTDCHSDLNRHMTGTTTYQNSITVFDGNLDHHPEFRSVRENKDPGNLKFNHALHLSAGMVRTPDGKKMKLSDISDEAERQRYARQQGTAGTSAAIQLDCASCHQLETARLLETAVASSAPSSGATMLPINYDNHCRACHPLTLMPKDPARNGALVVVPHRLQPDEVRSFLWGTYAEKFTAPWRQRPANKRPLPGQAPMTAGEQEKLRKQVVQATDEADSFLRLDAVGDAEKVLFRGKTTCGECHIYDKSRPQSSLPERIKPTNVPAIWFRSARFSHAAHHAVDCRACHTKADSSRVSSDVLLPGIAECVKCHAPAHTVDGKARGGVRFDCTECHRYHHGEGEAGLPSGARALAAPHPGSIEDFLSGKLKPDVP
jgi:hypothetical protein